MINDFTKLGEFPEIISGKAHLRMVTRFYKLRDVRQHVCRLRKILADPPKKLQLHDMSTKSDNPEVKTAENSKTAKTNNTADSKTAKTKNKNKGNKNKGKVAMKASNSSADEAAAKKKIPKVIIHQSPAGPGSFTVCRINL